MNNCPYSLAKQEMHILAYCYHWGNETLWDMPRSERKRWVDMIQEQKKAESEGIEEGKSGHSKPAYVES